MKASRIGIALAGGLLFGILNTASAMDRAHFQLYDDFSTKRLDPTKWFGQQSSTDGPGGIETVRRVNHRYGRLVMRHRIEGGNEGDGDRQISRNRLNLVDNEVNGMQFDAVVKHLQLGGCEVEGSSASAGKLRGTMFLFNDGSRVDSSDATGDIGAVIEVYRTTEFTRPRDQYQIPGFLFRCTDSKCSTNSSEFIKGESLVTVKRKQRVTLGMQWLPETDRVTFWRDNKTHQILEYNLDDTRQSIIPTRRLEIRVEAADCTQTKRPFAEMKAYFDNVFVHR